MKWIFSLSFLVIFQFGFSQNDSAFVRPNVLLVKNSTILYFNNKHNDWKKEKMISDESLKSLISNDIALVITDTLDSVAILSGTAHTTYNSTSLEEEIHRNADYYLEKRSVYDYKKEKDSEFIESKLAISRKKEEKDKHENKIKDGELAVNITDNSDKFLNAGFRDRKIFHEIKQQGYEYLFFITQISVEKDKTGKFDYKNIIKIDYTVYNNSGKFIFGDSEIQVLKKKMRKYDDVKKVVFPIAASNIKNNFLRFTRN